MTHIYLLTSQNKLQEYK